MCSIGLIAGASGVVIGHPFDTLKVFYQINPSKTTYNLSIRTLYRGILPPLLTSGSIQSINFTLYEYFKSKVMRLNYNSGMTMFIAASCSGAMMSIITAPIGMIKIRQQTSRFSQRMPSIPAVVRNIYSSSGITGFYRGERMKFCCQNDNQIRLGYTPFLFMESIGRGFYMFVYGQMKEILATPACASINQWKRRDLIIKIISAGSIIYLPWDECNLHVLLS